MHPDDRLLDLALGSLDPAERPALEEHLATCPRCRAELLGLQEAVTTAIEELPPLAPPARTWLAIRARLADEGGAVARDADRAAGVGGPLRRDGRAPHRAGGRPAMAPFIAFVAALVLVVGGGIGLRAYRSQSRLASEGRTVAAWLARPDVQHYPLRNRSGESVGSVLMTQDGRAMFVLREPAESGRVYQAWGHAGDDMVPLSTSRRPVFLVDPLGYDALYLSLEPPGGSPEPTVPLGWTAL